MLLSQKTVLNFEEASVYTGLSKSHLYKLTSTDGIPCYKPTGKKGVYFDKGEIDEWLLKNQKINKSETETVFKLKLTVATSNISKIKVLVIGCFRILKLTIRYTIIILKFMLFQDC